MAKERLTRETDGEFEARVVAEEAAAEEALRQEQARASSPDATGDSGDQPLPRCDCPAMDGPHVHAQGGPEALKDDDPVI